jgi:hypothetical protein
MSLGARWRERLSDRGFRLRIAVTVVALAGALMSLARFLQWNEGRSGVVLPDPFLAMYGPVDVTWLTFALIYGGLVGAVILLAREPERLLMAIQGYAVMVGLRIVAMWLVPLEPPAAMIALKDPFVEFFGGMAATLNKDLFFSGHTSTLFLLFLNVPGTVARRIFLACTVAVACCVLAQHAHYAIDVVVAFPFAFAAYSIIRRLNRATA